MDHNLSKLGLLGCAPPLSSLENRPKRVRSCFGLVSQLTESFQNPVPVCGISFPLIELVFVFADMALPIYTHRCKAMDKVVSRNIVVSHLAFEFFGC